VVVFFVQRIAMEKIGRVYDPAGDVDHPDPARRCSAPCSVPDQQSHPGQRARAADGRRERALRLT
jgi:hypothetical protein